MVGRTLAHIAVNRLDVATGEFRVAAPRWRRGRLEQVSNGCLIVPVLGTTFVERNNHYLPMRSMASRQEAVAGCGSRIGRVGLRLSTLH